MPGPISNSPPPSSPRRPGEAHSQQGVCTPIGRLSKDTFKLMSLGKVKRVYTLFRENNSDKFLLVNIESSKQTAFSGNPDVNVKTGTITIFGKTYTIEPLKEEVSRESAITSISNKIL